MKKKDKKLVRVINRKIARQIMKNEQGNNRIQHAWSERQINRAPHGKIREMLARVPLLRGGERQRLLDKAYRRQS